MTAFSEPRCLFFFSPDLRFKPLRFTSEDQLSVAVHSLIGDGDPTRKPSPIRCAWDAAARLQRAQTLLLHARSGRQTADAWDAFETEWRWVSGSAPVRKIVSNAAGDAAAAEVLSAVADELLPLLRLRAAILGNRAGATAEAAMHLHALSAWSLPEQSAVSFARAYAAYLRMLATAGQSVTTAITHNVVKILSRTSSDEVAEAFTALLGKWAAPPDPEFLAGQLEYVVQYALPRIDLRRLYASVEVAAAVKKINDVTGASEGIARLARARVLDPWSGDAAERLREAVQLRDRYAEAIADQHLTPSARVTMTHFLDGLDAALRAGEGFDGTDEGKKLRMQWNEAIARDAARGLGWNEEPESLDRARVLIHAIDEAFGDAEKPDPQIFSRAQAIARAKGLEPHDVPWDDIAEAFTKDQLTLGAALTFVLRRPGAEPGIEETVAADAAQPSSETPPGPTMIWLFSPRNWLLKTAAVMGVLMLLHVGIASAAAAAHRRSVQRQYDVFITAAQKSDRSEAISSGAALLASLDDADPQLHEVARLYRDIVFRQVVDLGVRGDVAGAQNLLQQYESVTGTPVIRSSLVD